MLVRVCFTNNTLSRSTALMLTMHNRRSRTPTKDFLIAGHPRIAGIHVATGGSGHGWKFLPIIGDLIVDSVEGNLPHELKQKWAFPKDQGQSNGTGDGDELGEVIRSR
jgi:sarcosine oxidase / L-pipecolate oxidase